MKRKYISLLLAIGLLLCFLPACPAETPPEPYSPPVFEVGPVSVGLEGVVGTGDPDSHDIVFQSAYLFETNVFDSVDEVEVTVYYSVYDFSYDMYYDLSIRTAKKRGAITRHESRIYVVNKDITDDHEDDVYANSVLVAERGIAKNGIYLCDEIPLTDSTLFPFSEYALNQRIEGDRWYRTYGGSATIKIPGEFFAGEQGKLAFCHRAYCEFSDGTLLYPNGKGEGWLVYYRIIDGKVYLSNRKAKLQNIKEDDPVTDGTSDSYYFESMS